MFVYIQIYFDIYICVSLGGHNLCARKLKFGMLLTQTLAFNSVLELPYGPCSGVVLLSKCIIDQIEHFENNC